jgi:hypothetical protein
MFLDLFLKNLKQKRNSQRGKELPIDVSELREAIQYWFRLIQKAHLKNGVH